MNAFFIMGFTSFLGLKSQLEFLQQGLPGIYLVAVETCYVIWVLAHFKLVGTLLHEEGTYKSHQEIKQTCFSVIPFICVKVIQILE